VRRETLKGLLGKGRGFTQGGGITASVHWASSSRSEKKTCQEKNFKLPGGGGGGEGALGVVVKKPGKKRASEHE